MPRRDWIYRGHIIEANPGGLSYKYLVWLSPTHLVAGRTFAELTSELDRLSPEYAEAYAEWVNSMNRVMPQGDNEHVIISADRPVEYGILDGNTIRVRPQHE